MNAHPAVNTISQPLVQQYGTLYRQAMRLATRVPPHPAAERALHLAAVLTRRLQKGVGS